MASEAAELPQSYRDATWASRIVAANLTVGVAATISVILRLIARRLKALRLGADDYAMIVGLVRAERCFDANGSKTGCDRSLHGL